MVSRIATNDFWLTPVHRICTTVKLDWQSSTVHTNNNWTTIEIKTILTYQNSKWYNIYMNRKQRLSLDLESGCPNTSTKFYELFGCPIFQGRQKYIQIITIITMYIVLIGSSHYILKQCHGNFNEAKILSPWKRNFRNSPLNFLLSRCVISMGLGVQMVPKCPTGWNPDLNSTDLDQSLFNIVSLYYIFSESLTFMRV